jgi:hypothetical protein
VRPGEILVDLEPGEAIGVDGTWRMASVQAELGAR